MEDEQPGEKEVNKEEVARLRGEEFEGPQEEALPEGYMGETLYTASLKSDFCRGERESGREGGEGEEEEEEEGGGEECLVCQEMGPEGEAYGYSSESEEELEEEEEELTIEERQTLDSQYLKSVLGTPLTFALLDVAMKRPTDPIQYLGSYLLKWRWQNIEKNEYEAQKKELDEEREAYREKMRENERRLMLEKEEREEEFRRGERDESTIKDDDDYGKEEGEGPEVRVEV